ncbi:MAG: hypothetical protein ACEQSK_11770 [Sphingomonadaceae bacterium]
MPLNLDIPTLTLLLLVPLAVWRIYSRLRAMMTRTVSLLWRHYAVAVVCAALLGVMGSGMLEAPLALCALALGAAAGAALGQRNFRLTRLENRADGMFYTPNMRMSVLIPMLFVSRVIYRFFELYLQIHNGTPAPDSFQQSPLTAVLFGLTAGYFCAYHLLLVRWQRGQKPVPPKYNLPPLE